MKHHTATVSGGERQGVLKRSKMGKLAEGWGGSLRHPVCPPGMPCNGARCHLVDLPRQAEPLNKDTELPAAYSGHFLIRTVFVAARPCARAPGFHVHYPSEASSRP